MDNIKKKTNIIMVILIVFLSILLEARLGLFELGSEKIDGLKGAATTVADLEIPEDVQVVGVGEATHGNVEFQELKMEVLKKLAHQGTCKSMLFEMPVADGEILNDYVHGKGEVQDAESAVGILQYPLYDTKEMAELVDWMKEQNASLREEESYRIYGIDPQGGEVDPDAPSFSDNPDANSDYRDDQMVKNLKNILAQENKRGYNQTIVTAHNGHVMKGDSVGYGTITFGEKLKKEFGDGYFVIGSEFYNTDVNINDAGSRDADYRRANHKFCSSDSLAKQAESFEDGKYCLDFSKITDSKSTLYKLVHEQTFMGMIGEGYTAFWETHKSSYRTKVAQAERFDAVVYYYQTHPIEPLHH